MQDVLIIGGRTTGLVLASELARRKVAVRIIDRSPGMDPHARANLIHSRTLEILHRQPREPLSLEPRGDFGGGPHAGAQAPDAAPIEVDGDTTSLYAWPTSANHRLFLFSGLDGSSGDRLFAEDLFAAARQAAKRQSDWIDVVFVVNGDFLQAQALAAPITLIKDLDQTMHARHAAEKPCLYLVRPDGYISYRSHRLDSLDTYLDHFIAGDRQ